MNVKRVIHMEDWEKKELERQIAYQDKQIQSLQYELQKVKNDLSNAKWKLNDRINDKSFQNHFFTEMYVPFVILLVAVIIAILNLKK